MKSGAATAPDDSVQMKQMRYTQRHLANGPDNWLYG